MRAGAVACARAPHYRRLRRGRPDLPLPLQAGMKRPPRSPCSPSMSHQMQFTVATYNIHKGFSHLTRRMVIHELKEKLHGLSARPAVPAGGAGRASPARGPLPRLAGQAAARVHRRHDVAGGRVRPQRRLPQRPPRQRAPVALPDARRTRTRTSRRTRSRRAASCTARSGSPRRRRCCIASTCTSGLFERGRQWQIQALVDRIRETVPRDAPMIIAGDFNDWRRKADRDADRRARRRRGVRGVQGAAGAHLPVRDAGVPPRPHLRARSQRRRRPRPLRVPVRPHVGPRGARGDLRGPAAAASERLTRAGWR